MWPWGLSSTAVASESGVGGSVIAENLERTLALHFPSTGKKAGAYWLSCACGQFDRKGVAVWAHLVAEWAVHAGTVIVELEGPPTCATAPAASPTLATARS